MNDKMELSEDADGIIASGDCTAAINEKTTVFSGIMIGHHRRIQKQSMYLQLRVVSHCPVADVARKILS
jgi:hypothetical protein